MLKAAVLSEGSSFKHYVYSAYGFSGSGKTRTLIHNPDDRQTRDKPVLELVTNALKTLTDCSIDMYINDLYGEITVVVQKGVLAHLIKKYENDLLFVRRLDPRYFKYD
jgi:hypothetical protein